MELSGYLSTVKKNKLVFIPSEQSSRYIANTHNIYSGKIDISLPRGTKSVPDDIVNTIGKHCQVVVRPIYYNFTDKQGIHCAGTRFVLININQL